MAANTLITSVLSAGSNNHTTVSEEANTYATDFVTQGVVGSFVTNIGSGGTGSFCVNADASPDMGVTIKAGQAYVLATPSSQNSQVLRVRAAADYTVYAINANASGSTKYDWVYLSINATNANNPAAAGDNVASFVTSRSSSNTTDNGTPPTYGILLAIVTVANGASSITNSNVTNSRAQAIIGPSSTTAYTTDYDYIDSGCVWSGDSYGATLNASMTSGVVRIGGVRLTVANVSARAFTASKDTYIDLSNNGDGTAAIHYSEVTNNAASPALSAGYLRIGIIVSGASSIAAAASVNQGQEDKVLPIASSIPYTVTDSLGNLICPRDPQRRILGYRQATGDFSGTGDVTGLSTTFIVPANRRVAVIGHAAGIATTSGSATSLTYTIQESTTVIAQSNGTTAGANFANPAHVERGLLTPNAGVHTYKLVQTGGGGTITTQANSLYPMFIKVLLV